jgi:hypothetical protein
MIGAFICLARVQGCGVMVWFVMEAKVGLHPQLEQGLLSCKPLSIPAAGIKYLQSLIIITQIMHGLQIQNSRLSTPSFWFSPCHVYTVKSEYKHCIERKAGVNKPLWGEF